MPLKNSKKGRLIVFEGPDGVGKTTLSEHTTNLLKLKGHDVLHYAFPGNEEGTIGRLVYEIQHDKNNYQQISKASLQALHIAAHIDAIETKIIPSFKSGKTIILDRFWWSTHAYGLVDGVSPDILNALIASERAAWQGISPDILFLIDRDEPLRKEPKIKWQKWRNKYLSLQKTENKHYPTTIHRNVGTIEEAMISIDQKLTALEIVSEITFRNNKPRKLTRPKPTIVFDSYWKFAAERQKIYFKRLNKERRPWTEDKILLEHKFTNAYRACDRVSQYLIHEVIYQGNQDINEVFFRTILFKIFNKIQTWEYLVHSLREVTYENYTFDKYDELLMNAIEANERIYSAAYIMPSGKSAFGFDKKHRNNLRLLEKMLEDDVPNRLAESNSMADGYKLLLSYPTLGPFLAYQFITDINYSNITNYSEMEFVVPGPGALDGIAKCFSDYGNYKEDEIIRMVCEDQDTHFERLGIDFESLWGRSLQLIDCQNLFCEISKYSRAAHPEFKGLAGRTRIKQKYTWSGNLNNPWFPPKWKINKKIKSSKHVS